MTDTAVTQISSPKNSAVVTAPIRFQEAVEERIAALEKRTVSEAPGVYRFRPGHGLTVQERENLCTICDTIDAWLASDIHVPDVERSYRILMASMKTGRDAFDPAALLDGLEIAFDGRCGAAFREAVRRIISGEAGKDYSKTYAPSTAELVTLTKTIEQRWELHRKRADRLLAMEEQRQAEEAAPASAEQLTAWRDRVRASAKMPAYDRQDPASMRGPSPAGRVAAEIEANHAARKAS